MKYLYEVTWENESLEHGAIKRIDRRHWTEEGGKTFLLMSSGPAVDITHLLIPNEGLKFFFVPLPAGWE